MIKESKGNMYEWVSHVWNPIKGKCVHDCEYCFMKRFKLKPVKLDKKELESDLGQDNFIFVGSSTDIFAHNIPKNWIDKVMEHCNKYPNNHYLFQSKNPGRFLGIKESMPENVMLCTTIETNRTGFNYNAPTVRERKRIMSKLSSKGYNILVTIEPVIDFDVDELVKMVEDINPIQVNIGADSKGNDLPEPSEKKLRQLVDGLINVTKVKPKKNLNRLMRCD